MADVFDAATRSRIMSRIRSKDTAPEIRVRKAVHSAGFRYRLHYGDLPGKPDLVFPRYRLVVFVHGCFWHGHDCRLFRLPKTNVEYWARKIENNRRRDAEAIEELERKGWKAHVIWQCSLEQGIEELLTKLRWLRDGQPNRRP